MEWSLGRQENGSSTDRKRQVRNDIWEQEKEDSVLVVVDFEGNIWLHLSSGPSEM